MTDAAHVGELALLEPEKQPADTGPVHLDPEEVARGMCRGEREKVLAVAEADLAREWGGAREQRSRLERLRREGDAGPRPPHLERALLCRRDPAAAGHEG